MRGGVLVRGAREDATNFLGGCGMRGASEGFRSCEDAFGVSPPCDDLVRMRTI